MASPGKQHKHHTTNDRMVQMEPAPLRLRSNLTLTFPNVTSPGCVTSAGAAPATETAISAQSAANPADTTAATKIAPVLARGMIFGDAHATAVHARAESAAKNSRKTKTRTALMLLHHSSSDGGKVSATSLLRALHQW
jgi:hypothetical protein